MTRRLLAVLAVAAVVASVVALDAHEPPPLAALAPLDCDDWRYGPADEPASLPAEYDRDDYRRTSLRDPRPSLADSPQNLCGQKGAAVDLAWGLSRGRPDVVIAVLDSGIRWRDPRAMADLATQAAIDVVEAPPPCAATVPDGDCNGDGRTDISDFGPIADLNGNGLADPEDLILDPAVSDGIDDDGDGYVDDISGWDFLHGDNNPFDTVSYGHGTGEALDSVAAENGSGSVGVCPGCQFLPVRVSDSFIADGGRFAAGVLYGLDQGADVIQEALGALGNPRQAQQAIDAAYARGVPVVASMADEASTHPNLPAALERTLAVNSVTARENDLLGGPNEGWLALNGCTNAGGRTVVTVPSNACSSEATGLASGMVGLLESYAREVGLPPHPDLDGAAGTNVLSAEEVTQIVAGTADDIDFATPTAVDPANDFGTPSGNPLIDSVRHPSRPGWDAVFGYGRVNAYEMLRAVRDGRIPPEARIDAPGWFELLPASGTVAITGRVAAVRADSFDYRVEWAPGAQPPQHPGSDVWTTVGSGSGLSAPVEGTLGTLDLAAVAASLPGGGSGPPVASDGRPDEERFSVRLRVVVTAHGGGGDGLSGTAQKQVFSHDDPDLLPGMPRAVDGSGTAGATFVDLDLDGADELVVGTDDGEIHAFEHDGGEVAGFPVRTAVSSWWPTGSPTAVADGVGVHRGALMLGGPAVADLDGDDDLEVVATDLNGRAYVWAHDGAPLAQMSVDPAFSTDTTAAQDSRNRTKAGFAAAPSLGDLDGDGDLEVVAAALDRHVYAWHHDGAPVAGFPVLVVDPATVSAVDPLTHKVTFRAGSAVGQGGELTATPALADLDGDGRPEIVVGAQEQYDGAPNIGDAADVVGLLGLTGSSGNSRLYAIDASGSAATASPPSAAHPHAQAYLPGWPVPLAMATTNLLPTIGDGVAMPVAIGDVHPDPGPEVVAASAAGPLYVLGPDGSSRYGTTAAGDVPLRWSAGLDLSGLGAFGSARTSDDLVASLVGVAGPSLGDLDGDGEVEITAPTAGITRLLDLLLADLQLPNDDHLSAWEGATGDPMTGSPQTTPDLAFFVAPAVADLDGDGAAESVAGNGVFTLSAWDGSGRAPAGWPKLTGGWLVGTPGVGDWDGDGTLEVAATRRDGHLLVWSTGSRGAVQWATWGCDAQHTGSCSAADLPVQPPTTPTTSPTATTTPPTTAPSTDTTVSPPPGATSTIPELVVGAPPDDRSSAAATASSGRTRGSGRFPVTGFAAGALVLAGLALFAVGMVLHRRSRRT